MKNFLAYTKLFTVVLALAILPSMATAQRPSFGGLQTQIDDLLTGNLDFSEVRFGDECTIGIDPNFTGLTERDPNGFRLLGLNNEGCILRFGPTDLCTVGVDPENPGLTLRDVNCFRFINPKGLQPKILLEGGLTQFGEECTLGIDPNFPGLTESDPNGFRLLGRDGQGCILTFGPTDECRIGIDPNNPGMTFTDPGCFRFINPLPDQQPKMLLPGGLMEFGPDCNLGINPEFPGLTESDPFGFRLLGQDGQGCILRFGPTDLCSIGINPTDPGMNFCDIGPFVFKDPTGAPPTMRLPGGTFEWGPECKLGVNPQLSGLVACDPSGLRLLGPGGQGCILTFGPTDECRWLVDPQRTNFGMIGQDVRPILFENPEGKGLANVQVDGTMFANEFAQLSRGDLKENVRNIEGALDKVKQLRGVTFDWKEEAKKKSPGTGSADFGFIAEEVAAVMSQAAVYDKDGKTAHGVKYANMVALVVESIKEQQSQIESQQDTIQSQNEKISDQQQQLEDQQDQLDAQAEMIEQMQQQLASLMEK